MNTWFDELSLAAGNNPKFHRRQILGGVVAGLASNLWGTRLLAAPVVAQPKSRASQSSTAKQVILSPRSTCQRRKNADGSLVSTDIVRDGNLSMQMTLTLNPDGTGASDIQVSQGGQSVLHMRSSGAKSGAGEVRIERGVGITGPRLQIIQTSDGKSFSGTVDGRAYTMVRPSNAAARPLMRFEDAQPAPAVRLSADLAERLPSLTKTLMGHFGACAPIATAISVLPHQGQQGIHGVSPIHPVLPTNPINPAEPAGKQVNAPMRGGAGDNGWGSPGKTYPAGETNDSTACQQCYDNANADYANHLKEGFDWLGGTLGPIAGTLFTGGANVTYAMALWLGDMANCNRPGGDCYPVPCRGLFEACLQGDACLESGICCASSTQPTLAGVACGDICCHAGVTSCASDGGCACPTGLTECGDFCCPPGAVCCDGQCYTPGTQCCNGIPCGEGMRCLHGKNGDICCYNESLCLDAYCCGLNTCTLDGCCTQANVCGDRCCGAGQVCQGGVCVASPCAAGSTYCNGQCCPSSDANGPIRCCTPLRPDVAPYDNMNYGCHHYSSCYTVPR